MLQNDLHQTGQARVDGSVDVSPPKPSLPPRATTGDAQSEPRSRPGAPLGNENARRHGLRSPRSPKSDRYIDRTVQEFRRSVETSVLAACGEISVFHAALIHTSCEATRVALAEMQELRKLIEADKLDHQHRTAKRQAALKALDLRDRKLRELGIAWQAPAEGPVDPWADFDEARKLESLPKPDTTPDAPATPLAGSAATPDRIPDLAEVLDRSDPQ